MAKYSSSELDPAQVDRFCRQNKFTGWFDTSALNDININEAVQLLLGKVNLDFILNSSRCDDKNLYIWLKLDISQWSSFE